MSTFVPPIGCSGWTCSRVTGGLSLLTDGMLKRRAVEADLPSLIVRTGALHPREASRALVAEVLRAHGGRLQDDATVLRTSSQPRPDG